MKLVLVCVYPVEQEIVHSEKSWTFDDIPYVNRVVSNFWHDFRQGYNLS